MESFLAHHKAQIKGTLSGFDRLRFRGTLRWIANREGMSIWLSRSGILYKHFKEYALGLTDHIKQATQEIADQANRPIQYLNSSNLRKETVAREIAERDNITEGLVCVLTCVEPCMTYQVGPNRAKKKLELRSHNGKCLHQYFYLIDPQLGWLNIRLQTWLPFTVKIVMNGREWLSRELVKRNIAFERRDNCFVDIADLELAQDLMDQQLKTSWSTLLNRLLWRVHPAHATLFGHETLDDYWSADESEWATDVMFRSPSALDTLYPRLVKHAMANLGGNDVLRFLGKRPFIQMLRTAELTSHLGRRHEGVRVKHALNGNSVKMYDKQDTLLRVETTINNTRQMKVYRTSEADPDGPMKWLKLRKGVADLHRRAEISQKCNERYLESLAAVNAEPTLALATQSLCQRAQWKGRSVRALNPLAAEDAKLIEAVNRGEFTLLGFRNRDLCKILFSNETQLNDKQKMTKVTRLRRLLRAHGLIQKISRTHRYQLTNQGRQTITALLTARQSSTRKLSEIAA